jgi:tetratricopeptide (TPR) repeat protein
MSGDIKQAVLSGLGGSLIATVLGIALFAVEFYEDKNREKNEEDRFERERKLQTAKHLDQIEMWITEKILEIDSDEEKTKFINLVTSLQEEGGDSVLSRDRFLRHIGFLNKTIIDVDSAQPTNEEQVEMESTTLEKAHQQLLEKTKKELSKVATNQPDRSDKAKEIIEELNQKQERLSKRENARKIWQSGYALYKEKKYEEAKKKFEEARSVDECYAPALNSLGNVAKVFEKDEAKAKGFYEKSIACYRKYVPAHFNLALLAEDSNETDLAKRHLETVLKIDPTYTKAITLKESIDKKK